MPVVKLEAALARTVADNRDDMNGVSARASNMDLKDLVANAPSGDWLIDELLRLARLANVERLDAMTSTVQDNVAREGAALLVEDPSTVGVIDEKMEAEARKVRGER